MRKTKIVCTIGPACDSEEMLRAMMLAGMNVARLNFSHGTHAEHQVRIDRIKKLRTELGLPIAIMLDTKGPEYRIGTFEGGKITLNTGDTFTFTTEPVVGSNERVSVSYSGLAKDLEPGDTVLVNDGLIAPGGMGLGVVELVDVRPMTEADVPAAMLFDDDVEDALKGFAWHVKPLYEVIPFPVKGKLNFFEVDDDLLKRLPDGYEDHCDYMYQQGLRWKDEDDPLTLEEFLEQQGLV